MNTRQRVVNIMSNVYPSELAEALANECLEQARSERELCRLIGEQLFYGTAGDGEPVILQLRAA
jgi:hypothetical protein